LTKRRGRQGSAKAGTARTQGARQSPAPALRRFTIKSWALTEQLLQGHRDRTRLLDLMGFYDWLGDSNLKSMLSGMPPLPCKAGCAYCCYVGPDRPDLLPVELYRIAAYLAETSIGVRTHVMARLEAQDDPKAPCLFLSDERCTIYPVRPMRCRAQHSPDVVACRQSYAGQRPTFPLLREPALLLKSIGTGIRLGLQQAGLEHTPLSATKAVRLALERPEALDRWLAGEPVFGEATYPGAEGEARNLARFALRARRELAFEETQLQPVLSVFGERAGAWYAYTRTGVAPIGMARPRSV
jgi:hypothetical protein